MPSKFLRGLAIAAGTGIAIGIGSSIGRGKKTKLFVRRFDDNEVLRLEPLLNRLDSLESKVAGSPRDLEARLERQSEKQAKEVADLRVLVERRVEDVRAEAPLWVETGIGVRLEELRVQLHREIETRQQQTLESFEVALELKISARIRALDEKLNRQSLVLDSITRQSEDADQTLQRLIVAVERLAERTPSNSTSETLPPSVNAAPFQDHLEQAMNQDPAEFRFSLFQEKPKKNGASLAPLMMIASVIGARFLR